MLGTSDFPIKVGELEPSYDPAPKPTSSAVDSDASAGSVVARNVLDAARGRLALASLLKLDGLLGCALVDAGSGLVLAHETREPQTLDMEQAAAACAQVLSSHRDAAHRMGLADPIDEIITTAGARHILIRALQRHPELVLVALLEKHRTNLALARFQLLEVERSLP
jgi:predicted regulator of Ras-like GTPase activity (Roadblock/LC7/MglB family)